MFWKALAVAAAAWVGWVTFAPARTEVLNTWSR
jgi:hypothetical protein